MYGVRYMGHELHIGDKAPMGATLTLIVGDGSVAPSYGDSIDAVVDQVVDGASEGNASTDDSWF